MSDETYDRGYYEVIVGNWLAGPIHMVLLDDATGPVFDPDHDTVEDVLSAAGNQEVSGTAVTRPLVPTRSYANDVIDHGNVDFGAINAGVVGAAVYFLLGDTDAESPVLFFKTSGFPFTTDGLGMVVATSASGLTTVAKRRRNSTRRVDLNAWVSMHEDLSVSA